MVACGTSTTGELPRPQPRSLPRAESRGRLRRGFLSPVSFGGKRNGAAGGRGGRELGGLECTKADSHPYNKARKTPFFETIPAL